MHKNITKCNKTQSKWCVNKHGASKIIDTFEMYQQAPCRSSHASNNALIKTNKQPNCCHTSNATSIKKSIGLKSFKKWQAPCKSSHDSNNALIKTNKQTNIVVILVMQPAEQNL
jgi:hypothetical protein